MNQEPDDGGGQLFAANAARVGKPGGIEATGGGSTSAILAEVQRVPDRKADQTATWSLLLLRDALRKTDLPQIAKETIRGCAPRVRLQLPAHTHMVPYGLCRAQAQKRHGDDL